LSTDMMAVATCQKWQNISVYDCAATTSHEYFP
jgi:hypothetical protein